MATIPWDNEDSTPTPFSFSLESLVEEYLAGCCRRGLSPKTVVFAYGYPSGTSSCRGAFTPALATPGASRIGSSIGSSMNY